MKALPMILTLLLNVQDASIAEDQISINISGNSSFSNESSTLNSFTLYASPSTRNPSQTSTSIVIASLSSEKNETGKRNSENNGTANSTQTNASKKKNQLYLELLNILRMESYFRIADLCCAILCFAALTILKLPKSSKFFVHKHLVLALGVSDIFAGVLGHEDVRTKLMSNKVSCTTNFVLNYYWSLVTYAWMVIEAYNISVKLTKVFDTSSKFKKHMAYLLFGYCIPAFITAIVAVSFYNEVLNNTICFSFKGKAIWLYRGPILVYLFAIYLAFIYIIGFTCKHICQSKKYEGGYRKFLASIRTFLVLYPILGISQVLFLFWEKAPIPLGWTSVLCNSFLATIFFILHVVCDSQVQEAAAKMLGIKRNTHKLASSARGGAILSSKSSVTIMQEANCKAGYIKNNESKMEQNGRCSTQL